MCEREYVLIQCVNLVSTSLGKLSELVSTDLLGGNLLGLLGSKESRDAGLGSDNKVGTVETTDELLLDGSSDTASVGSLVEGGLGQGLADLGGGDVGRLVVDGNTVLSGNNVQSL